MDFFEHLKRDDLHKVRYPFVSRATKWTDRLVAGYLKRFNGNIAPMKPVALVNDMPVYDLTQPPIGSEAGTRVLKVGFDYMVLKKQARPINMVVMINDACDMNCTHCSAQNYMKHGKKPMSYQVLRDLVDQFIEMGGASFVISGGEPTLYKKLLKLIDETDKSKVAVSMFTNGSRVSDLATELRSVGLFGTLVSLDSNDPAVHDRRRGFDGAFKRALKAIETLKANEMLVGISTYISRFGMKKGSFEQVIALGEDLGVDQVFCFDAVPTGALMHGDDWVLTLEDREILKEMIKAQNASPSGPAVMGQSWVNSPEGIGCFAGFYQIYVTAAGDVCPCDFTPITFGNVCDEPLQTIWDRMRASADWGPRFHSCRMQDKCFRAKTVDLIPPGTAFPVPYETILKLQKEKDTRHCEPHTESSQIMEG